MAYVPIVPYADKAYAAAYFADKIDGVAEWNAGAAKQDAALAQSTKQIDLLPLVGNKCDSTQIREFPRDVDDCAADIPIPVMDACCEVALALINGLTPEAIDSTVGIASENAGDAATSYTGERGDAAPFDDYNGLPSKTAVQLLAPWIVDSEEIDTTRV